MHQVRLRAIIKLDEALPQNSCLFSCPAQLTQENALQAQPYWSEPSKVMDDHVHITLAVKGSICMHG